jgi:hypothetical protein
VKIVLKRRLICIMFFLCTDTTTSDLSQGVSAKPHER